MGYWKNIMSSKETASSKRLVTLVMAAHLIVTSFLVSFFTFYLIVYVPKGSVNVTLIGLLQNILDADLYIVLAGLSFITGESLAQIVLEKTKVRAAANVQTGSPTAETINVDTVNVQQSESGKTKTATPTVNKTKRQ